jgi:hypothetical protein
MTAPDTGALFTGETTTDPADTTSVELIADELPALESISTNLPPMVSAALPAPTRAGRPARCLHAHHPGP